MQLRVSMSCWGGILGINRISHFRETQQEGHEPQAPARPGSARNVTRRERHRAGCLHSQAGAFLAGRCVCPGSEVWAGPNEATLGPNVPGSVGR